MRQPGDRPEAQTRQLAAEPCDRLSSVDATLIFLFWPLVNNRPALRMSTLGLEATAAYVLVVALFANLVAIFPGERLYAYVHTPLTRAPDSR